MSKTFINYNQDDTISKYFKDNKNSKTLSFEREVELANKIKEGDKLAVDELVKANLKFVVTIAKEYMGQGLPLSDLINEGNYGLIKAAHKFDATKGFKFISYAVWWVRQSILFSLNENGRLIRLPFNITNKLNHIKDELEKFEFKNERQAFYGEELNDDGDKLLLVTSATSNLNDMINEDGDELYQIIEDKSNNNDDYYDIDEEVKDEINIALSKLSDRERLIIELYFGLKRDKEPMTLEAIGELLNLSKERIRQIKEKSIRILRHYSQNLFDVLYS
jgi:RNA polymerase primary sigma factor